MIDPAETAEWLRSTGLPVSEDHPIDMPVEGLRPELPADARIPENRTDLSLNPRIASLLLQTAAALDGGRKWDWVRRTGVISAPHEWRTLKLVMGENVRKVVSPEAQDMAAQRLQSIPLSGNGETPVGVGARLRPGSQMELGLGNGGPSELVRARQDGIPLVLPRVACSAADSLDVVAAAAPAMSMRPPATAFADGPMTGIEFPLALSTPDDWFMFQMGRAYLTTLEGVAVEGGSRLGIPKALLRDLHLVAMGLDLAAERCEPIAAERHQMLSRLMGAGRKEDVLRLVAGELDERRLSTPRAHDLLRCAILRMDRWTRFCADGAARRFVGAEWVRDFREATPHLRTSADDMGPIYAGKRVTSM